MTDTPASANSPTTPIDGQSIARVVLKPRKALPFYGRHPWVLDSGVDWVERVQAPGVVLPENLDGQVVDLLNEKHIFIARGYFNSQSRIRVRLMTWRQEELLDRAFWKKRLQESVELRRALGYETSTSGDAPAPTGWEKTATRLVFSEGDRLGGLVLDRYGEYLVLQATSLAVAQRATMLAEILQELLPVRGILLRTEKSTVQLEGVAVQEGLIGGTMPPAQTIIEENGIQFALDLTTGQKTGFFLDQRENRLAAARYAKGARVLDMFCYTGGFGLTAAKVGGAQSVLGIDGSQKAVDQANANASLNGLSQCTFETGDGFDRLDAIRTAGEQYDLVVLDPPKFSRNRSQLNQALMAYHRLNRSGVSVLRPGGILVTCSCSGTVGRDDFLDMLSGVAQKSKRELQILEVRGAAPDHPFQATCLESEYLKCVIARVL
ncbi:MAG: class I SAM-dependent rRNA methyltransferase [Planctomycetaceae bacterium]